MTMPGIAARGPTFKRISEASKNPAVVSEALQRLTAGDPLLAVADHFQIFRADDEVLRAHVRDEWLEQWWGSEAEDILRAGLIQALTLSNEAEIPIECIWVCPKAPKFEVINYLSGQQVTMIVITPEQPAAVKEAQDAHHYDELENIWVTRRGAFNNGQGKGNEPDTEIVTRRMYTRKEGDDPVAAGLSSTSA